MIESPWVSLVAMFLSWSWCRKAEE